MRICVVGWYFDDELYSSLWRVNHYRGFTDIKYPVFIIAHRNNDLIANCDLPCLLEENVGLEWGAYNQYLTKVWDGNDSVLFMHDDIKFLPLIIGDEIKPGELVFDKLAAIQFDHAYIFQSRMEDVVNYGRHGRMVYFSERLLRLIKSEKDFPWLKGKEDVYLALKKIQNINPEWSLLKKVYVPNVDMGYEGKFGKYKLQFIDESLRLG